MNDGGVVCVDAAAVGRETTVSVHVSVILRKLGAASRTEAVYTTRVGGARA